MTFRESRLVSQLKKTRKKRRQALERTRGRNLKLESLEPRQLLAVGPQLIGIQPNNGSLLNDGDVRNIAPVDLTFRFDENSVINPATLNAIRLTRSGFDGTFGNGNDVAIQPGFIGLGEVPHEVVMRFSSTLPDDVYQIDILGTGPVVLRNMAGGAFGDTTNDSVDNGKNFRLQFELDLGAQIISVVPQPITRVGGQLVQARNQIHVYFNNDDLLIERDANGNPTARSADNPAFYQLILTRDTVRNTDDVVFLPQTVQYDPAADRAVLTFASSLDELIDPTTNAPIRSGTFRLRIGTDEAAPLAPQRQTVSVDPGSSFDSATPITVTGSLILSSAIEPEVYRNEWPGALDEPGHRGVRVESHINGIPDTTNGVRTFFYNFQDAYGFDPEGNLLHNLITENQKQRAREIFEIYSELLGVQFVESQSSGLTIVTGDLRALSPDVPTGPGGVLGIAGGGMAIMDNAENWDDRFGGSWFGTAMHEIGHLLGLGHSYELPPLTVQGAEGRLGFGNRTEPDYPGDHDVVHGQLLHRPDSNDIDLYRFELSQAGLLSIETFAERLPNSSLLDSRVALWKVQTDANGNVVRDRNGNPVRQLIAQNDDYYSEDSFLRLLLTPGTYFVGVSASGNDSYDPTIPGTGIGGTSQGKYDLRLTFRPDAVRSIVDDPVDLVVMTTGSSLQDGQSFTIAHQGTTKTFEFDSNGALANTGAVGIPFNASSSARSLAGAITTAINQAFTNLRATNVGTQIRFSANATVTLGTGLTGLQTNLPGTAFDGDHDGTPGGVYDFWFRTATPQGSATAGQPKTLIVDRSAPAGGDGSLARPFNNIGTALSQAQPRDVVRIVGNGGGDQNLNTLADNLAYEIGFNALGLPLRDGSTLAVPKDVTVMIDANAIFKLRRARVGVGSSTLAIDRSGGALQVLGTPGQNVFFTSYNDESIGLDTDPFVTFPRSGDWGGLVFRADLDRSQERFLWEREGIFLNYVNHADIRYGGGNIVVDSVPQVITPIHMTEARPTITYNTITRSADAALSADPNSFEESNFHDPASQISGAFTSDYDRVGPDIHGNRLLNNSTNGLFVRIQTPAGTQLKPMTVSGRWDDTEVVHVVSENLVIQGTPGGPVLQQNAPPVVIVTLTALAGGTLTAGGTYNYRIVFVDAAGNESLPSDFTRSLTLSGGERTIRLDNLPQARNQFVARRIYRSNATGDTSGPYTLVAQIDASSTRFVDDGTTAGGVLTPPVALQLARYDARLAIDPGTIVKLEGARIDVGLGAQLIAEGSDGREVVFTSRLDDRFGGSGTFDTNNDDSLGVNEATAKPGDWGGIFVGHYSRASIDHALFTYGGGINKIEGTFAGFNVLEIHQAEARVTNSIFERNAQGTGGQSPDHRFGRGFNDEAVIFVRGAQPILVGNNIRDNTRTAAPSNVNDRLAAININANALNHRLRTDWGRATGFIDRIEGYRDNQGPLIRENLINNNELNGLKVRAETLTTQGVWDDTDIVHLLFDTIYVPDFHTYGGLRLESSPTESLVVKLFGPNAGFTATGRPLDITDRIGGIVQVVGQPGSPVVLTSLRDDTAGAGFRTLGVPNTDTNNDGTASQPQPGDWRSVRIDQYAHDRNVEVILEQEARDVDAPGPNAIPDRAQVLGVLAPFEKAGDDKLRLGFEIHGFLTAPNDLDVYSFRATAGTEIWLDIDRSTHALDTVVELLDQNGQVIARSNNSMAERDRTELLFSPDPLTQVNILQKSPYLPKDFWGTNPRDAGMRVILPGTVGSQTSFFIRVRSSSSNLDSDLLGGLTSGVYQLQLRLDEMDEVPGSTVRFADIRYATDGIEVFGQPIHSPLGGEAAEAGQGASDGNNSPGSAQNLGNLLNTDRAALAVAGVLGTDTDVDFYQFDVSYDSVQSVTGFSNPFEHLATIFDIDYADGMARADIRLAVFDANFNLVLVADNSNIADDQPKPINGADVDDLNRGSAGIFDPYIGTQELPVGRYYVAVSTNGVMPQELEQFITSNAVNRLLRLEPVDSVVRIAEDHIGSSGGSTARPPIVPTLLDQSSVVPFTLADVTMFVSRVGGIRPNHLNTFYQVNPFTGAVTNIMNDIPARIGDIAMRYDGQLFAYSHTYPGVPIDDSTVGNYLRILTGVDTFTPLGYENVGDDNIETWEVDPASGNEIRANFGAVQAGVGIWFNAMTFAGDRDLDGFAVGDRGEEVVGGTAFGVSQTKNILYQFNINTGQGSSNPSPQLDRTGCPPGGTECRFVDAGTQIRERGQIVSAFASITTPEATDATVFPANFLIQDGNRFTVTHDPVFHPARGSTTSTTFEFDAGPEVRLNIDPTTSRIVRDGYYFALDTTFTGTSRFGYHFQFDTGTSIAVPAGINIADNTTLFLQDTSGSAVVLEFVDTGAGDGQEVIGSLPIFYDSSMTRSQMMTLIEQAINSVPTLNITATALPSAGIIALTGDDNFVDPTVNPGVNVNIANPNSLLAGNSNVQLFGDNLRGRMTMRMPVGIGLTLQVPTNGGAAISDGQSFVVNDGTAARRFEFEDIAVGNGVTAGSMPVPFNQADSPDQIRDAIITAIRATGMNLNPVKPRLSIDDGLSVHIGGPANGSLTTVGSPLTQYGVAGGLTDGQTFSINNGHKTIVLEFDLDGIVQSGNLPLEFDLDRNAAQQAHNITNKAVIAINAEDMRLAPANLGTNLPSDRRNGVLQLNRGLRIEGDRGEAPIFQIFSGGQFRDGQFFRLGVNNRLATFEFDFGDGVAAGNIPILLSVVDSAQVVAQKIAEAVNLNHDADARAFGDQVLFNGPSITVINDNGANPPVPTSRMSRIQIYNNTERNLNGFIQVEENNTRAQVATAVVNRIAVPLPVQNHSQRAQFPIQLQVDNHGLASGQAVMVQGVQNARGLDNRPQANGVWTVTVVDNNNFLLNNSNGSVFDWNQNTGVVYLDRPDFDGDRMNFQGVNTADFRGSLDIFSPITSSLGGVQTGNVRLGFLASDTAGQVAQRIRDIVHRELFPTVTALGGQGSPTVSIQNGNVSGDTPPFTIVSGGTGGTVTGLAAVGNNLYAVDDQGGLYVVSGQNTSGATSQLVTVIKDQAGLGVRFAGLTAGPKHAENQRYANMLFGIDVNGQLYAFNTQGVLQPVFVDGATSISTGVTNVNGIAFSNLDVNLWHITTNRDTDPGHGINAAFDQSRLAVDGGQSFWFGFENPARNGYSNAPDPRNRGNYNFPGGAHGSIETAPFSLAGYSKDDLPTLYFNYFLGTEGVDYVDNNNRMRDSFRVFIADESGDWQLLGTNNSFRHQVLLDEYELGDFAVLQANELRGRRGIQELYDNTGWRQVRVDLGAYAGRDDLKLRFEFTTAGEMNDGDPRTTGQQLRAVPGVKLRDGDTFVVDGTDAFQFDLGYTLVTPAGAKFQAGEQLSIRDGNGVLRTFTFGGNVPIGPNLTAEQIATNLASAISASGLAIRVHRNDNRVNLEALSNPLAVQVTRTGGTALIIEGAPGATPGTTPARLVRVHAGMTQTEVRDAVRQQLANQYAGGVLDAFKIYRDVIRIIGHTIAENDRGPLGVNTPSAPAPRADGIPRDYFGSFYSNGANIPGDYPNGYSLPQRNTNNNHEGVYVDDIVIGFAERGEMATGSVAVTSYRDNPQVPESAILVGPYQLEMRRGTQYGNSVRLEPHLQLFRTFDTNDRLVHQVSFVAPAADKLADGMTFHISDGVDTVTFEFDDVDLGNGSVGNGVRPGNVPIYFDPTLQLSARNTTAMSNFVIAARIRDAINSAQVQSVLDIQAGISDGTVTGLASTSFLINLYGNATGDASLTTAGVHPAFAFTSNLPNFHIAYGQLGSTTEHRYGGEFNRFRDQGQILIHSNLISHSQNFGVVSDAGQRRRDDLVPQAGTLPHAGPPRNLREVNVPRWLPGVVIENNLVYDSGSGGIHFSGDANLAGERSSIPFGRITNNTVHGRGEGDVGILVTNWAGPTLLNNIVSNFETGISVDATSNTTVIGGTVYKDNAVNSLGAGLGDFPIVLTSTDPLFVDASNRNFYLAPGSLAIDSSIDTLEDRPELVTVKNPLGIAKSPILTPDRDVTGQLRVDDPQVPTPAGQGANVFKDRGAFDRSDFVGPTAVLLTPRDNDADGNDRNLADHVVRLPGTTVLSKFTIQLIDGVEPADASNGLGLNDKTVTSDTLLLRRNGVPLVDGVDYTFNYNATTNTVQLTPIAGIWPTDAVYTIELVNKHRFSIRAPHGSTIADGAQFTITGNNGQQATFEFDRGFSLQVPQTFRLHVPAGGGAAIQDGEVFTISNGGTTVTFQFDNNNNLTNAQHRRIAYTNASTADAIANELVQVLSAAGLGLNPRNLGGGVVHLGSRSTHAVNLVQTSLTLSGQARGLADGQTFAIDDGTRVVTFEMDDQNVNDGVAAGNVAIPMTLNLTHVELADRITSAIAAAGLGLSPRHLGGGTIHVGGTAGFQLTTTNSALSQFGRPGVTSSFGVQIPTRAGKPIGVIDGETFTITDGNSTVTFELDSDGSVTPGNRAVAFDLSASVEVTASALVNAVNNTSLGLTAVHRGHGAILLNGSTSAHVLNVSQSSLLPLGTPGVPGNIAVPILPVPEFDARQVAVAVRAAINASGLAGVTATAAGGAEIIVEGAVDVDDTFQVFVRNELTGAIQDLAGNNLKPNQLSGETQFTIILGDVASDLGDAPEALKYPTRLGSNGAVHVIATGIFLGSGVDSELDGLPSASANGDDTNATDDEDGVQIGVLNEFVQTPVDVTASVAGLLDAWIDFNRDGDWEDAGEQVFASHQVTAGLNRLLVSTPSGAEIGTTYARFRFSTSGGLRPTGLASDGEVEDYQVEIRSGTPPTGVADVYTIAEGGTLAATDATGTGTPNDPTDDGVLANDSDADSNAITAVLVSGPSHASSFTLNADGTFTYVHNGSETTADKFTYRAKDDFLTSSLVTVTLNITPVNDPPQASADAATTDEDTPISIGVLANDVDSDNSSLTIESVNTTGTKGTVTINANGTITYNPNGQFDALKPGDTATDTFSYTVTDGSLTSTAVVTVTIDGLNDKPQPGGDAITTGENQAVTITVLNNDTDPENDPLTVTAINTTGTKGSVVLNADGTISYNPNGKFESLKDGQTASDSFTYTVSDGQGGTATATVQITVTGENDGPAAVADAASTAKDATVKISVLANDTDAENDPLTITATSTTGTQGTVTINADGTITYDPAGKFNALKVGEQATDTFTYTIDDGSGLTSTATVTVTVIGVNKAPQAVNDAATVNEDSSIVINVLANDSDPEGDVISVRSVNTTGTKGKVTVNASGTITYNTDGKFESLRPGQTATDVFTYTIQDARGDTSTATVTVTITGVNDPPVGNSDTYSVIRGRTLNASDPTGNSTPGNSGDNGVLANDVDAEGDTLTAVLVSGPSRAASFALNANGTFSYRHDNSNTTSDSFTYRASDGTGQSALVTVTIQITPPPPSAWQNPRNHLDINDDSAVSPIDALLIINFLNFNGPAELPAPSPGFAPPPYYDSNGDSNISAIDALLVVNRLNQASGEGESAGLAAADAGEGESAFDNSLQSLLGGHVQDVLASRSTTGLSSQFGMRVDALPGIHRPVNDSPSIFPAVEDASRAALYEQFGSELDELLDDLAGAEAGRETEQAIDAVLADLFEDGFDG